MEQLAREAGAGIRGVSAAREDSAGGGGGADEAGRMMRLGVFLKGEGVDSAKGPREGKEW